MIGKKFGLGWSRALPVIRQKEDIVKPKMPYMSVPCVLSALLLACLTPSCLLPLACLLDPLPASRPLGWARDSSAQRGRSSVWPGESFHLPSSLPPSYPTLARHTPDLLTRLPQDIPQRKSRSHWARTDNLGKTREHMLSLGFLALHLDHDPDIHRGGLKERKGFAGQWGNGEDRCVCCRQNGRWRYMQHVQLWVFKILF